MPKIVINPEIEKNSNMSTEELELLKFNIEQEDAVEDHLTKEELINLKEDLIDSPENYIDLENE